jgi:cytidylate kinase
VNTTATPEEIVPLPQSDRIRKWLAEKMETEDFRVSAPRTAGPAITISYQTGAGENEVARLLAGILEKGEQPECKWAVFDRQLVEKVLEEHDLPKAFAQLMPEQRRSYIQDVMEELVGLRPPSWVMVPKIAETVLHLAEAGHVVLVGRGANFITARMSNVFHVRLISPLARRIARVSEQSQLTPEAATKFVGRSDHHHRRYVKTHFHGRSDDDLLYHLVLNTDRIPTSDAAQVIADAARRSWRNPLPL